MISEQEFLSKYDITIYDRPSITVDTVSFTTKSDNNAETYRHDSKSSLYLLLTCRQTHPFIHKFALPGGFLDNSTDIKNCALQNITAKTSVTPVSIMPLGCYGDKNRDPRGWIVSNAFISVINKLPDNLSPNALLFAVNYQFEKDLIKILLTSDIANLEIKGRFIKKEFGLPVYKASTNSLAFDHDQIIIDAVIKLLDIAENFEVMLDFMPESFTLAEFQQVTEIITNKPTPPANFRRKVMPFVIETNDYKSGIGHRPAKLFKRKS